jgi:hypothetical protein
MLSKRKRNERRPSKWPTEILNDVIEHVSTDLLIRILASLGYRVRVSVVRSGTAA